MKVRYWVALAVRGAGLALIRGEGLFVSGLAFLVAAYLVFKQADRRPVAIRFGASALLFLLLLIPWLAYNYWAIG